MASSMSMGERRWVSARRGGMTILGKVAVPRPVNLPSQRSENHGLDPNVEIVPRGTLSWPSRSSSTSNAWGSPTISSPTDGNLGSPGHLIAHSSSVGSCTRPSTAGSDRSHEPVSQVWDTNSRPSSSSSILVSSHSVAGSMRPQSAETRPNSSQLSRFAEPIVQSSAAWAGPGTAENLGSATSKPNSFTLSSGDFPTLGSDKKNESNARQDHSSHGRPSSSGGAVMQKEISASSPTHEGSTDTSREKKDVNTWKRESSPYRGGGFPSNVDNWQRDPQQAPPAHNANISQHHFDYWHGGPIRNPPPFGVCYRGAHPPDPYGPVPPPCAYPLEPSPYGYYHPQSHLPARPVSNTQSVPISGASQAGYHPKNGDMHHHHRPDTYVVPTSVRPVRFPMPIPPFDGYYGPPPINFCNPIAQDARPVTGTAVGPVFFNQNQNQNVHHSSGNFHVSSGGYGPTTAAKERIESAHAHNPNHQGPYNYRMLSKQHDDWGGIDDVEARENSMVSSNFAGRNSVRREYDWEADHGKDEQVEFSNPAFSQEVSSQLNNQGHFSVPCAGTLPKTAGKAKVVDDNLMKKPEPAVNPTEGPQLLESVKKNPTLIEKVEGLNSKARVSDGRSETKCFREGKVKAGQSNNETASVGFSTERGRLQGVPSSNEVINTSGEDEKTLELPVHGGGGSSFADIALVEVGEKDQSDSHRGIHGMQTRVEYRGKARFNVQESEEWRKKSPVTNSSPTIIVNKAEASSQSENDPDKQASSITVKAGGKLNSSDYKAQRAKMKEIAAQRARQLQKEEEERIRDQKAKALVKLEELNRRTNAENSSIKVESDMVQHQQEENHVPVAQKVYIGVSEETSGELSRNTEALTSAGKDVMDQPREPANFPVNQPLEASSSARYVPVPTVSSVPLGQDDSQESPTLRTTPQVHDDGASKQKQMVHRKKQNILQEKSLGEKLSATGGSNFRGNAYADAPIEANSVNNSNNDDRPLQHKKKNNRSLKNKHKLDESLLDSPPLGSLPEGNPMEPTPESGKMKPREPAVLEASSVLLRETLDDQDSEDQVATAEQEWTQSTEDCHGVAIRNHWKPHPPRGGMPRSNQATRPAEAFHINEAVVWAPVKPRSKHESSLEGHQDKDNNHSSDRNGHVVPNNLKNKRAEMERYVPKPVAKELSQQSNSQQPPTSSISHTTSDEMLEVSQRTVSAVRKAWESKHNKHSKTQRSWHQRGSTESSVHLQSSLQGHISDTNKPVQKSVDQHHLPKFDSNSPKQQGNSFDDWNDDKPVPSEPVAIPVVREQGVSGRGKRQSSKPHLGGGRQYQNNPGDTKDLDEVPGKIVTQAPFSKWSESDGKTGLATGIVEHGSAYWQPKGQAYSHQYQHGSRGDGGQKVAVQVFTSPDMDGSQKDEPHRTLQRETRKANVAESETRNVQPHEIKRERKGIDPFKEGSSNMAKQALENADLLNEQHHEDSPRMHGWGQRNGYFNRTQDGAPYHGGSRGIPGKETPKQQIPSNRDRKKPNYSHYEYQAVGSNHKPNYPSHHDLTPAEESWDDSRGVGLQNREQGLNHSRRGGHFYRRNAGGGRV